MQPDDISETDKTDDNINIMKKLNPKAQYINNVLGGHQGVGILFGGNVGGIPTSGVKPTTQYINNVLGGYQGVGMISGGHIGRIPNSGVNSRAKYINNVSGG